MKIVVFNLWGSSHREREIFRNTAAILSALMSSSDPLIRKSVMASLKEVSLDEDRVEGFVVGIRYIVYNNPDFSTFFNGLKDNVDADYIHISGHGSSWLDKDNSKQAAIMFSFGPVNVHNGLALTLESIKLKPTCCVFFEICKGFDVALCMIKHCAGATTQLSSNNENNEPRIGGALLFSLGYDDVSIKGFPGALWKCAANKDDLSEKCMSELLTVLRGMLRVETSERLFEVLNFCNLNLA